MKILYIFLCCAVYITCADEIYDPLEWYDEVDFDTLFDESNEADIPKELASSEEFVNDDKDDTMNQAAQASNKDLEAQNELDPNTLDEYSDDYQIEDNRSEVKDDLALDRNEEDTSNQDELLKKLDDDFKEPVRKSENQEAADDFDDFQKLMEGKDLSSIQLQKVFEEMLSENDGSKLDLSDLFSDENKPKDDIVEPLPVPPLNEDSNEEKNKNQNDDKVDSIKSLEPEEIPEQDLELDMQDIFEITRKILEETNDQMDDLNKFRNNQVSAEEELKEDSIEKEINIPNNSLDNNNFEEDSVAQVYKDLNDDLDKLLETMNKLTQDDFSEEQNPDDAFDVDASNVQLEETDNLEILHADGQSDQFDLDNDSQDELKQEDKKVFKDKEDAALYVFENDALEAAENEYDESNPNFHPADSKKDNDEFDTEFNSADSENEFAESNPDFHPADSKKVNDELDTDFNSVDSEDQFDESNPDFHPADSKKDDHFETDFNSADSQNEFDESNPNFHPADSKKDDGQYETDFNSAASQNEFDESNPDFHSADSKKDDGQFETDFNSDDSGNEFDESNPNFHPADSKKNDDDFNTDFNSASSENKFDESNPDFHPADSKKSFDDLSDEIGVISNVLDDFETIEFEEVDSDVPVQKVVNKDENVKKIPETDMSSSEVQQKIITNQNQIDDMGQGETSEKKITKNVEDLTGFELEQLTRQFVMVHKNELAMDSENLERNAEHKRLNAYEPEIITSPYYPNNYPTTGDAPKDWILDGEGHGIELNVTDLAINSAMGHYLLIKPGGVDASGSDGIVFAFRLDEPRKYRFRNVDRMFVRFNGIGGQPFLRGFNMSVKMIEPLTSGAGEELPEPEPVVPAPQAVMTLLLGGRNTTEFEEIREEFRRLLADMAIMYINANGIDPGNNSTYFTTQITRTYVCNLNWPGFESCVEVRFAIPLVYDEDYSDDDHRLSENDLIAMWYSYVGQDPFATRLRRMGITEYTIPNEGSVMMVWLLIAAGVLISMVMLGCTMWRFSCFNGYTRHYTQADNDSLYNEKRGLDMYPTPHQTLPPLYSENEYKWQDNNFDDTKVDMGGFTNRNYVRGDLSDESEDEVIASRDRGTFKATETSDV